MTRSRNIIWLTRMCVLVFWLLVIADVMPATSSLIDAEVWLTNSFADPILLCFAFGLLVPVLFSRTLRQDVRGLFAPHAPAGSARRWAIRLVLVLVCLLFATDLVPASSSLIDAEVWLTNYVGDPILLAFATALLVMALAAPRLWADLAMLLAVRRTPLQEPEAGLPPETVQVEALPQPERPLPEPWEIAPHLMPETDAAAPVPDVAVVEVEALLAEEVLPLDGSKSVEEIQAEVQPEPWPEPLEVTPDQLIGVDAPDVTAVAAEAVQAEEALLPDVSVTAEEIQPEAAHLTEVQPLLSQPEPWEIVPDLMPETARAEGAPVADVDAEVPLATPDVTAVEAEALLAEVDLSQDVGVAAEEIQAEVVPRAEVLPPDIRERVEEIQVEALPLAPDVTTVEAEALPADDVLPQDADISDEIQEKVLPQAPLSEPWEMVPDMMPETASDEGAPVLEDAPEVPLMAAEQPLFESAPRAPDVTLVEAEALQAEEVLSQEVTETAEEILAEVAPLAEETLPPDVNESVAEVQAEALPPVADVTAVEAEALQAEDLPQASLPEEVQLQLVIENAEETRAEVLPLAEAPPEGMPIVAALVAAGQGVPVLGRDPLPGLDSDLAVDGENGGFAPANYRHWDTVKSFAGWQVAWLWHGWEPEDEDMADPRVLTSFIRLEGNLEAGVLGDLSSHNGEWKYVEISRQALVDYAIASGERPKFLFAGRRGWLAQRVRDFQRRDVALGDLKTYMVYSEVKLTMYKVLRAINSEVVAKELRLAMQKGLCEGVARRVVDGITYDYERIPRYLWHLLKIDWLGNLEGPGMQYTGLMVKFAPGYPVLPESEMPGAISAYGEIEQYVRQAPGAEIKRRLHSNSNDRAAG